MARQPRKEIVEQREAPMSVMNFVASALTNPDVDANKLRVLLDIQRDILADEAKRIFHQAMNEAQAAIAPIVRDAENKETHSRYARLETIDAAIRPIYSRCGFTLSFDSAPAGEQVQITCKVAHLAGHAENHSLAAALDTLGPKGTQNKTKLHGLGSTITYLRRYLTCMIFNIVMTNDDDDGNSADPVDDDFVALVRREIEELEIPADVFLDFMHAASIEEIQERDRAKAINALAASRRKRETKRTLENAQ